MENHKIPMNTVSDIQKRENAANTSKKVKIV